MPDDETRHAQGMGVRREVLGDEHVDRANAKITPFTEGFQDFITRYAWGELWSGDGVDRRTRSMLTLQKNSVLPPSYVLCVRITSVVSQVSPCRRQSKL